MKNNIVISRDDNHRYIGNKTEYGTYRLSFQEFMPSIKEWRTLDTHLYDESYYQYLLRTEA